MKTLYESKKFGFTTTVISNGINWRLYPDGFEGWMDSRRIHFEKSIPPTWSTLEIVEDALRGVRFDRRIGWR